MCSDVNGGREQATYCSNLLLCSRQCLVATTIASTARAKDLAKTIVLPCSVACSTLQCTPLRTWQSQKRQALSKALCDAFLCWMQHYAVKTIENIASQGGHWGTCFASREAISYLVTMWHTSRNDTIRSTAASTLSRLLRHSSSLVGPTLEKYNLKPFVQGMLCSLSSLGCPQSPGQAGLTVVSRLLLALLEPCWAFFGEVQPEAFCPRETLQSLLGC